MRARRVRPIDAARPGFSPADHSAGVAVVSRDAAASALADPLRRRVLELLQAPGSATTVARTLGLTRQRVNYHVRALEQVGLVEEVARRQRRGASERLVRATAAHYVVSPEILGSLGSSPPAQSDRFSATFQIAVAARTIREVADLAARAKVAGRRLTTLSVDTALTLGSPAERDAFADDLVQAVNALVAKYHRAGDAGGRTYRLFLGAHPAHAGDGKKR